MPRSACFNACRPTSVARISTFQESANESESAIVMAMEYGSSPVEQPALQKRLVLHIGLAHAAQQIGSALKPFCAQVLAHTSGEEPLARFIETNPGPLFDQHADLTQFVFA